MFATSRPKEEAGREPSNAPIKPRQDGPAALHEKTATLIISADIDYHGCTDREAAVYLPSKPKIQDNAYYQELSTSLILAVIASYLFRVSLRIIER